MAKVFMFIPGYGHQISSATFLTSHAIYQAMASKGIGGGVSTLSFPDIAELRDMALTIWYDTLDATHLLFIDSDMAFSPELVLDMLLFDEPVVGTVYPHKRLPMTWVGSGSGQPVAERRGGFMRVEGVGGGCFLIRRDAVTVMLEKMPEISDSRLSLHPAVDTLRQAGANRLIRAFDKINLPDRGIISEDLSFCLRWNQCGGAVWANVNHRISHIGVYDYAGRYLDGVEAAERAAAEAAANTQATQTAEALQAAQPDPRTMLHPYTVVPGGTQTDAATDLTLAPSVGGTATVEAIEVVAVPDEMKTAAE